MTKRSLVNIAILAIGILLGSMLQPLSLLPTSSAQAGCQTFPETGKTICGGFLNYWNSHGGLAQQGYPISNEFQEVSDLNGKTYTVQYFERAVFEYHPENTAPYDILLSQLGTFRYKAKYSNGEHIVTPPPPPIPPGIGVRVPLREDGVSITLLAQGAGIRSECNEPVMVWVFKVENNSSAPFTEVVDPASVAQVDNSGKVYEPRQMIGGCWYRLSGDFERPKTLAAKSSGQGTIAFTASGITTSTTYFDLTFNISGTTVKFRYPLH